MDGQLCAVYDWPLPYVMEIIYINCNETLTGSIIRIIKTGPMLTLCEVNISENDCDNLFFCEIQLNYETTEQSTLPLNRPRSKPVYHEQVSQSTQFVNGKAENAVDGNPSGRLLDGSCSQTDMEDTEPWWQITFDKKYTITRVVIVNSQDCCCKYRFR